MLIFNLNNIKSNYSADPNYDINIIEKCFINQIINRI